MWNHRLQCCFICSNSGSQTFSQFFWKIHRNKISRFKCEFCVSLCFCIVIHHTRCESSWNCERVSVDCSDLDDFSFCADIVFIVFKTRNHIVFSKNSFSRCDWNRCCRTWNVRSQFRFQGVFVCIHLFFELNYKSAISHSSLTINAFKSVISVSASQILQDCEINSSWTSCNVHAVIEIETMLFASKLCATCEKDFGLAVSSETQLSAALSTVIVFQFFAVAFIISRTIVSHQFFCSTVKRYGNVDGNIHQSLTRMIVESDEIALVK